MLLGSAQNMRTVSLSDITVKFRDHDLQPVSETKNLGVIFDRTLNWDAHVSIVANRCIGILSGI